MEKYTSQADANALMAKIKHWIRQRKIKNTDIDSTGATNGQVPTANGSGGTTWTTPSGGVPTVTIALSQVISQDPLQIQLTNEQYNIFANNKQVLVDASALGEASVVWNYQGEDPYYFDFSFFSYGSAYHMEESRIAVEKDTKIGTLVSYRINDSYADGTTLVGNGDLYLYGELSLTGNLPYLTTAPSSDNTSGYIKIVVLSQEPQTKYNGYLYLITASNA